jgi:hypothetical protein
LSRSWKINDFSLEALVFETADSVDVEIYTDLVVKEKDDGSLLLHWAMQPQVE